MAQTCWIQDRKSFPDPVSRVTRFSAWSIQVEYPSLGRSPHDHHPLSEGCLSSSYTCKHSLPSFLPLTRYEIFSAFFRFLPYSGQEWDETIPLMPAQQLLGLASRFHPPQPMTTCLPVSLSRILQIACCLIWAVAAILMAPRVVAQQPASLTNRISFKSGDTLYKEKISHVLSLIDQHRVIKTDSRLLVLSGVISTNVIVPDNFAVYVPASVRMQTNCTLTVGGGVVFMFEKGCSLEVNGDVHIKGSSTNGVYFSGSSLLSVGQWHGKVSFPATK